VVDRCDKKAELERLRELVLLNESLKSQVGHASLQGLTPHRH
jgi:hypothetical protein